jgi:hypothetical protein
LKGGKVDRFIKYAVVLVLLTLIYGCATEKTGGDEKGKTNETTGEVTPSEGETSPEGKSKETASEPTIYESGEKTFAPISASFSINAEDAGSGVKSVNVSIDGSDYKPYEGPVTFSEEGFHTVKYYATDYVGNSSVERTYNVTVDNTMPYTSYRIDPEPVVDGEERFVLPECKIVLTASDELSGVQKTLFSIDGAVFTPYGEPISMPGPGPHTFSFRSQDNVGIWEKETTLKLVVDGNSPETELKASGPLFSREDEKWAPVTRKYYLSATDDVAGVKEIYYSIDGGEFVPYSNPIELEPGAHKITYYAIDRAKNREGAKAFRVNIDSASPEISLATKAK